MDRMWPALSVAGTCAAWVAKAGILAVCLLVQMTLWVMWVLLVLLLFNRLPRPLMRYL